MLLKCNQYHRRKESVTVLICDTMKYQIISKNKYFSLLLALLLFTVSNMKAQCTSWGISAVTEPSLCAASGKITLSFTGTGSGNVTNMLYSLDPVVAGGYTIAPNTSSVFENIPAGNYIATAKGICGGNTVSATTNVTVTGNYIPFTAAASQNRVAIYHCNTGQAYVTLKDGKAPFTITIASAPAGYTGPTSFVKNSSFLIDSLWSGDYTLSIRDNCSSRASLQNVTITELRQLASQDLSIPAPVRVAGFCNKLAVRPGGVFVNSPYINYYQTNWLFTYCTSYDGGPRTAYRNARNNDTITLPGGQTLANAYGKTVTYYYRSPCGNEVSIPYVIPAPFMSTSTAFNCATDFNAEYTIDENQAVCYPVTVTIKNNATNAITSDVVSGPVVKRSVKNLPFGSYTFNVVTADGLKLRDNYTITVNRPATNPYQISKFQFRGTYGNDGAISLSISRAGTDLIDGTTVTLISPSEYTYTYKVSGSNTNSVFADQTTGTPVRNFYPGDYLFRLTDTCGTYDLPIQVTEEDVYRYNWGFTTEQTCTGLYVIPTGKAKYRGAEENTYFKIIRGPQGGVGFDGSIVPSGDTLLLPTEGAYKIGVSAFPTIIEDNSIIGNGLNVKTIDFKYVPLQFDVNKSLGWICPGQPDNSGTIQAYAFGGSKANTKVYTYKLAAQGQGGTGPFLATNTTGRFSTAISGGAYQLMKDQNYDIRVEDECGSAAVQTIKILDFATAELVKADKEVYCIGESIHFSIINLPATAITYAWTGPDNFTSPEQNPTVYPVKETSGGNYHVVINSDMCQNPIQADINIELAAYTRSCYSVITDASVNPYANNLLGNWKLQRTYSYYALRTETSTTQPTNIRNDGTIANFVSFWKQGASGWTPQYDTSRWVWTSETTLYNKRGMELENVDPLGRYNAGIYGFDDALNMAVVQNSRYRESAYEGFEDYFFGTTVCDTACSGGRSFDFSAYKNDLDSTQQHTGKYSLRIGAGKSAGISALVTPVDSATFSLSAIRSADNCTGGRQLLDSIRTNKDAILPVYAPFAGKKILISAWVKEENGCKGLTYTGNRMNISIRRGSTATVLIATPRGGIIDGWQRYEQPVDVPADATELIVTLQVTGTSTVYLDDLRIHPFNANMRSFVYDPSDLKLMAELDENNYATFYEYDDDGTLVRLKKETESGIRMIRETRNALIK